MEGIERILEFCFKKKEALTDFYEKTSINEERIKAIRKRKSGMPEEVMTMVANTYPELNMRWVITGAGEMLNSNKEQKIAPESRELSGDCADCVAELQAAKQRIIDLQDQIISLLKK